MEAKQPTVDQAWVLALEFHAPEMAPDFEDDLRLAGIQVCLTCCLSICVEEPNSPHTLDECALRQAKQKPRPDPPEGWLNTKELATVVGRHRVTVANVLGWAAREKLIVRFIHQQPAQPHAFYYDPEVVKAHFVEWQASYQRKWRQSGLHGYHGEESEENDV